MPAGFVTIANPAAERMLDLAERARSSASRLPEAVPELAPRAGRERRRASAPQQQQIQLTRAGRERTIDGAGHQRAGAGRGARLRGDARRHHRPRPAQRTSAWARRGPPHRPRDQEPADPDPALGRAHPAQVRQGHHRRQGGVRPVHRDDHAPGGRDQAHGRRVLVLRPDAEARDRRERPHRDRQAEPVHDAGGASRTSTSRSRPTGGAGSAREDRGGLRHPAAQPGDHQHPQERRRGGGRGARGRARQGQDRPEPRRRGRVRGDRGDRQRQGISRPRGASACSSPT